MRKVPDDSTPVINEIIEALACTRLTQYEFNIIFAIIRKTYGWDKKMDWVSLSQLSEITKIPSRHCCRTIKSLLVKNIIIKKDKNIESLYKSIKKNELNKAKKILSEALNDKKLRKKLLR